MLSLTNLKFLYPKFFIIFIEFLKSIGIALKIQCPQGRAGSTPAAGII